MPSPPRNRATRKKFQLGANAQSHDAQGGTAADALTERSTADGAEHCAPQRNGDGEAELPVREPILLRERVGGSGNDRRVEAEEQPAKSSGERTLDQEEDGLTLRCAHFGNPR